MADAKEMVQQIIKYSDGTETVINYNSLGQVVEPPVEEVVEPVEEPLEELTEVPTEEVVVEETLAPIDGVVG